MLCTVDSGAQGAGKRCSRSSSRLDKHLRVGGRGEEYIRPPDAASLAGIPLGSRGLLCTRRISSLICKVLQSLYATQHPPEVREVREGHHPCGEHHSIRQALLLTLRPQRHLLQVLPAPHAIGVHLRQAPRHTGGRPGIEAHGRVGFVLELCRCEAQEKQTQKLQDSRPAKRQNHHRCFPLPIWQTGTPGSYRPPLPAAP